MTKPRKKIILVVSHDAGGAEIISAYIKKYRVNCNFECLAAGPAKKIFIRKKLTKLLITKTEAVKLIKNNKIDLLLTGISWATDIGFNFIKIAKSQGIKTAIYLDHWGDYRQDFAYPKKGWQENLTDELWVGDKYALALAKKLFTNKLIRFVPNLYFQEIKKEYKKIKQQSNQTSKNILFMSEPIGTPTSCFIKEKAYQFSEYDVLKKILQYFKEKKIKNKIVICYHPSEKKDKYDVLFAKYSDKLMINKQTNNVLQEIAQAELIIGIMSMIIVIAILCDKKAVSFIPDIKVSCPLPFDKIIKIKTVKELDNIIS